MVGKLFTVDFAINSYLTRGYNLQPNLNYIRKTFLKYHVIYLISFGIGICDLYLVFYNGHISNILVIKNYRKITNKC